MNADELRVAFEAVLRRNLPRWCDVDDLERRRIRREVEADFLEAGYSPADARELALMAERYADALDPPRPNPPNRAA